MDNKTKKILLIIFVLFFVFLGIYICRLFKNDIVNNLEEEKTVYNLPEGEDASDSFLGEHPMEYENSEYGFYVDTPNISVTKREMSTGKYAAVSYEIIYENSEKMLITIPGNPSEWRTLISSRTYIGEVSNGNLTFEHWTLPGEFGESNYYIIEIDGFLYDISTTNQEYLDYFGFL